MRTETIDIPIYEGKFVIIKVDNYKEVNTVYGINAQEDYDSFVFISEGKVVLVIKIDDLSVMAHETVHIVNCIFKDSGVKLDLDNDEPQAYLTGWIFSQILNFLKKT